MQNAKGNFFESYREGTNIHTQNQQPLNKI